MTSQVERILHKENIIKRLNKEIENRCFLISTDESIQKINEAFLIVLCKIRGDDIQIKTCNKCKTVIESDINSSCTCGGHYN